MSNNPTLNGTELKNLEAWHTALAHLSEDYNDGGRWLAEAGDVLCVKSRARTMPNHLTRYAQECDSVRITTISVRDGQAYMELREN